MGELLWRTNKYMEKCMCLFTTKSCKQVYSDPTKTLESKVQRSLTKLKSRSWIQEIISNRKCQGNVYGTAKLH